MKISSKGRYGLRSMVDLTVCGTEDHVSLGIIAARQHISENYLEQVFSTLRKAGLVKSIKGAQGGYILAKHPSKIKIGDILRALEGSLDIVDNTEEDNGYPVSIQNCIKVNVWDKINECMNQVVDSITLQDLANAYREMSEGNTVMYYI